MAQIPVALQLYSVRDETAKDYIGTARRVAEIGYAGVEFAGYGGLSAVELKNLLADLNLRPAGAHVGMGELTQQLPAVLEYQLALGNPYIVCPALPGDMRDSAETWKRTAEVLNGIGATCAAAGLQFCYHNHDFEFTQFDGQNGMDLLYGNTDPRLVQAELDVFWVTKGGENVADYITRFTNRLPLLHVKDMTVDGDFAEFGEGTLDWDAILPAAECAGTQWFIVEQDVCKRPSMECIATSMANFKAKGLA